MAEFDPLAQFYKQREVNQLRGRLLGLQEPLDPSELVQALMESASRRGVDVPAGNLLNLLRSAQSQDVGKRRLFTPTGDLLSQRLPFMAPGIMPSATELQKQVEFAAMPPSRARLLQDLGVAQEFKKAEWSPGAELKQKVLIKTPGGKYRYQVLGPGEQLQLAEGEELISPREPGEGAASEAQAQRSYFALLNRAQSQAALETKLKYPSSQFTFNSMTGEMTIGQNTPPEALTYFQDIFKTKGRAMSKGLPGVKSLFDQAFPEEPKPPQVSGRVEMGDAEKTLTSLLFTEGQDPDVVAYIQQLRKQNIEDSAIVAKLQALGVIK